MHLKTSDGQHLISAEDFDILQGLKNDLPELKRSLMNCVNRMQASNDKNALCKLFRVLCDFQNKVNKIT
jgi:hypothetical protein